MNRKYCLAQILVLATILAFSFAEKEYLFEKTFEAHQGPTIGLAIFSEEKRIVTGGIFDKKVKVWNADDHTLLHTFEDHKDQIRGVVALKSGDKRYILSHGFDSVIYIWDLFTFELVHKLDSIGRTIKVFQFEGTDFIVSQEDTVSKVWNFVKGGEPIIRIDRPHENGTRLTAVMTSDPMQFATVGNDYIRVWDAKTGKQVTQMRTAGALVYSLIYVKHLDLLLTGDNEGFIYSWYWKVGRPVQIYKDFGGFFPLELLSIPNSNILVAAGFGKKQIFYFDLTKQNQQPLYQKHGHINEIWRLQYLEGTGYFYSSSADYSTKKWTICKTKYDFYNLETHTCIENCVDKDENKQICLSTKSGEKVEEESDEVIIKLPFMDDLNEEL
ncbi:hypothetical protein ABPG74_017721 [Tetrahymena malaccensis]